MDHNLKDDRTIESPTSTELVNAQPAAVDKTVDIAASGPNTLGSLLLRAFVGPRYNEIADAISSSIIEPLRRFQAWYVDIQPVLKRYAELFNTLAFTERDAHRALVKYKWIITPSMPPSFLFRVAEVGRRTGNQRRLMNRLFIEFYTGQDFCELEALVESWSEHPLFRRRITILRDCVAVMRHAEGRYNAANVVIPTLISQIDGVLTEFMSSKGISRSGIHWIDNSTGSRIKWDQRFESHVLRNDLFDSGNRVFLKVLFRTTFNGQRLPSAFNRHKIMHGEFTRYGYTAHAIRCFLILDFMATL